MILDINGGKWFTLVKVSCLSYLRFWHSESGAVNPDYVGRAI